MNDWQKAIINAGIMGGITFLSVVVTAGGCITLQSVQTAAVAFGLTFLTLCSKYFRPPEGDVNEPEDTHLIDDTPKSGGGLIGAIGCLWV